MNKLLLLLVTITTITSISCGTPENTLVDEQGSKYSSLISDTVSSMKTRIDVSNSNIILDASPTRNTRTVRLNNTSILNNIRNFTGSSDISDVIESQKEINATIGDYSVRISKNESGIYISDSKKYDKTLQNNIEDSYFVNNAKDLIVSLGAKENEISLIQAATIMAVDKAYDEADSDEKSYNNGKPYAIGTKVYFWRSISGVPVEGDFSVVSFNLDGTFRKLKHDWQPINYNSSTFKSEKTQTEVIELAAQNLLNQGVKTKSDKKIKVRTFLKKVINEAGNSILKLTGSANVPKKGPKGTYFNENIEFEF